MGNNFHFAEIMYQVYYLSDVRLQGTAIWSFEISNVNNKQAKDLFKITANMHLKRKVSYPPTKFQFILYYPSIAVFSFSILKGM